MSKISGYVCVREGIKLDYCFQEAILSLVPACDEVVVCDSDSTDGTTEAIHELIRHHPSVRLINRPWKNPKQQIHWWTDWLNWTRERLNFPLQLTLDADEVLCPKSIPTIKQVAADYKNDDTLHWNGFHDYPLIHDSGCRWFHRLNFWGGSNHLVPPDRVCGDKCVRMGPTKLWMPSDEPHPEGEPEIRIRAGWPPQPMSELRIFHYGFIRKDQALFDKCRVVNGAFFGPFDDARLMKAEKNGTRWVDEFKFDVPIPEYEGEHPDIMHPWLNARGHGPAACVPILPFVKPHHIGVEIGVHRGVSSGYFLRRSFFMFLIDVCAPYDGNPDSSIYSVEAEVRNTLAQFGEKFTFIADTSLTAASRIPIVDFVFVDANHEYEYVKQDIQTYWPKIKSGGFMSGHDYDPTHPGVPRAVNEFFGELGLPVEDHSHCWMVIKP